MPRAATIRSAELGEARTAAPDRRAGARRARRRRGDPRVSHVQTPLQFGNARPVGALPGEDVATIAARQKYRLPFIAVLNGAPLMRADWARPLADNDNLLFVTLPLGGAGVKDTLRSVLQIAVAVAATYFLGPGGLGLSGWQLGAAVAATQIGSAYLINAILPPVLPSAAGFGTAESGSPTYSLTSQGNQARLNQPKLLQYGEMLMVPDLAAAPYTEFAGNDLYLYELFSLGLGEYAQDQILIEDTALWDSETGLSDSFSDIDFEIIPPGSQVTLFPADVITSVEVSGQTLEGPNLDGDWLGPYIANPTDTVANYLALDFVWPSGAFYAADDGSLANVATALRAEIRKVDNDGLPIGDWTLFYAETVGFATRTQQRVSKRFAVAEGRYEVRAKRTNNSGTDSRTFDEVQWTGLRAYLPDVSPVQRDTRLAMRSRATNQLSAQASRRVRVRQTRKLPVWTGSAWTAPQPTRDIFPAVADLCRNANYSAGMADRRIDLATLAALQETWTARGDEFNGVIDSVRSLRQALTDVLRVGRAQPVMVGDVLTAVRDEAGKATKAVFTPRNTVRGSFSVDSLFFDPETPDDVIVEYWDRRFWATREVRCTLPGSASLKPARIQIPGVTERAHAWREGMYQAAANRYRRRLPMLTTEFDGRLVKRGDLVKVAHPMPKWGQSADLDSYDAEAGKIVLAERVTLALDETNFLTLRRRDGTEWGPVIVTAGEDAYTLIADDDDLVALIADPDQGDPADFITVDGTMEPTVGIVSHGKAAAQSCLVSTAKPEGATRIALALVVDDPRVHLADQGEMPAEVARPTLPPVPKGPNVGPIAIAVRGERFTPDISASVPPSPGTVSYIWEISYDHESWEMLQFGTSNSWSGAVRPSTIWLRCTGIGTVRGSFAEVFRDLTATDAPPAAIGAVSYKRSLGNVWLKFSLPVEDGVKGVLVKYSTDEEFDPETEGSVIDYSPAVSEVRVPIDTDTIYVRVAAYNVFGTAGLNWSTPLAISPLALTSADFPPEITEALEAAVSFGSSIVFKVTDEDGVSGGMVIMGTGAEIDVAWIADRLLFKTPTGVAPIVVVDEDGMRINNIISASITTDELKARVAEADVIRSGRYLPATGDAMDINTKDVYLSLKRS